MRLRSWGHARQSKNNNNSNVNMGRKMMKWKQTLKLMFVCQCVEWLFLDAVDVVAHTTRLAEPWTEKVVKECRLVVGCRRRSCGVNAIEMPWRADGGRLLLENEWSKLKPCCTTHCQDQSSWWWCPQRWKPMSTSVLRGADEHKKCEEETVMAKVNN